MNRFVILYFASSLGTDGTTPPPAVADSTGLSPTFQRLCLALILYLQAAGQNQIGRRRWVMGMSLQTQLSTPEFWFQVMVLERNPQSRFLGIHIKCLKSPSNPESHTYHS